MMLPIGMHTWFPLLSEQLRLRALTKVYLLHPRYPRSRFSLSTSSQVDGVGFVYILHPRYPEQVQFLSFYLGSFILATLSRFSLSPTSQVDGVGLVYIRHPMYTEQVYIIFIIPTLVNYFLTRCILRFIFTNRHFKCREKMDKHMIKNKPHLRF